MASRVVLKVTPAAGTRFEKVYPRAKMDGLDHVPLVLLANELAESAEKQLRDSFPNVAAAKSGSMETTVKLVDLSKPVSKPLYTILDCARRNDPNLLELDTDKGTLPIYVEFKAVPRAKGEDQYPHRRAILQVAEPARSHSVQQVAITQYT